MIIYKVTNLIDGMIYIGQDSTNKPKYFGSGKYLRRAIKKYGRQNFKKEILEFCNTREELNRREEELIAVYNATNPNIGYNIKKGGHNGGFLDIRGDKNPMYGKKHTKETKEYLSKLAKGKKLEEKVGEVRAKELREHFRKMFSGSGNPCFGKKPNIVCCLFCKEEVDVRNATRWHGEKCLKNPLKKGRKEQRKLFCEWCRKEHLNINYKQYHGIYCLHNPNRVLNLKRN